MGSSTKLIIAILAIPVILILCYFIGIKKTFEVLEEHDRLQIQSAQLNEIPLGYRKLVIKENQLDSILKRLDIIDSSIDNNIVRALNRTAKTNNVEVLEYNSPHKIEQGNGIMATYNFTLSGDFNGILKTIYSLEQQHNFGQIIHCQFTKENRKLVVAILLQRFI